MSLFDEDKRPFATLMLARYMLVSTHTHTHTHSLRWAWVYTHIHTRVCRCRVNRGQASHQKGLFELHHSCFGVSLQASNMCNKEEVHLLLFGRSEQGKPSLAKLAEGSKRSGAAGRAGVCAHTYTHTLAQAQAYSLSNTPRPSPFSRGANHPEQTIRAACSVHGTELTSHSLACNTVPCRAQERARQAPKPVHQTVELSHPLTKTQPLQPQEQTRTQMALQPSAGCSKAVPAGSRDWRRRLLQLAQPHLLRGLVVGRVVEITRVGRRGHRVLRMRRKQYRSVTHTTKTHTHNTHTHTEGA